MLNVEFFLKGKNSYSLALDSTRRNQSWSALVQTRQKKGEAENLLNPSSSALLPFIPPRDNEASSRIPEGKHSFLIPHPGSIPLYRLWRGAWNSSIHADSIALSHWSKTCLLFQHWLLRSFIILNIHSTKCIIYMPIGWDAVQDLPSTKQCTLKPGLCVERQLVTIVKTCSKGSWLELNCGCIHVTWNPSAIRALRSLSVLCLQFVLLHSGGQENRFELHIVHGNQCARAGLNALPHCWFWSLLTQRKECVKVSVWFKLGHLISDIWCFHI